MTKIGDTLSAIGLPPRVVLFLLLAASRLCANETRIELDLGGGVSLAMVLLPAGSFTMGSPAVGEEAAIVAQIREIVPGYGESPRRVTFARPFYLGVLEVTQAQYEAVMGGNPSHFLGADLPVEMVSWHDAAEFCRKLSRTLGKDIRLPTEAEWEYACRAGTAAAFHTGDAIDAGQANFDGQYPYGDGLPGEYREKTTPAGSFPPNAWGLHDMHGNVWEWCADWYGPYPAGEATDPRGPEEGRRRVLRGGSWYNIPRLSRSAARYGGGPHDFAYDVGFRVAMAAGPEDN